MSASTELEQAAGAAAENPDAVTQAVAASHAAPAPSDPLEQRLAAAENRLRAAEQFIADHKAEFDAVKTMVASAVPQLDPAINRISQLETWAASVVDRFMGKIPPAPRV